MDERGHPRRPSRQRPRPAPDALCRGELHQDVSCQRRQGDLDLSDRPGLGIRRRVDAFQRQYSLHPDAIRCRSHARTKKLSGVTIATPAAAPITRKFTPASPSVWISVMFVLNGLPPRLMVVNTKTGAVEVNRELSYGQTYETKNIHGQFRRARYTAQGTYLLSYLCESKVVEYDKNFNEVWKYPIRSPWAALRLKNGNTLITDEQDSLTREVNPKGETVWEFNKTDLPEAYRFQPSAANLHAPGQRQHDLLLARRRRQRPAARRSDTGQKGRVGAARLAGSRRRHRRANPRRSGHS